MLAFDNWRCGASESSVGRRNAERKAVMRFVRFVRLAFVPFFLAAYAAPAAAEDISGTLTVTKVIFEDSQLVGNVTCTMTTTQCIQFGAPNIALRLHGFTITGP